MSSSHLRLSIAAKGHRPGTGHGWHGLPVPSGHSALLPAPVYKNLPNVSAAYEERAYT